MKPLQGTFNKISICTHVIWISAFLIFLPPLEFCDAAGFPDLSCCYLGAVDSVIITNRNDDSQNYKNKIQVVKKTVSIPKVFSSKSAAVFIDYHFTVWSIRWKINSFWVKCYLHELIRSTTLLSSWSVSKNIFFFPTFSTYSPPCTPIFFLPFLIFSYTVFIQWHQLQLPVSNDYWQGVLGICGCTYH